MKPFSFLVLGLLFSTAAQAEHFCYYLFKDGQLTSYREPPYSLEYPPREPLSQEEMLRRKAMGSLVVAITDVPCDNTTQVLNTEDASLTPSPR